MTCYEDDEDIQTTSIYKNDDTNAFGRHWLVVNAPKGIDSKLITKCEFQCGSFYHEEKNPEFPFYIDPSAEDTKKLDKNNYCFLKIYDSKGRGVTLEGTLKVIAKKQVIVGNQSSEESKNQCNCDKSSNSGRVRI